MMKNSKMFHISPESIAEFAKILAGEKDVEGVIRGVNENGKIDVEVRFVPADITE